MAVLPCCLIFWLVTAPAGMAVRRIISGGNHGSFANLICKVTDWYQAPMVIVYKIQPLRTACDALADWWCEALGAPDTTA